MSTAGSIIATTQEHGDHPQKELRNNVADVLRRAEAGEELTITVAGRPVAQLGPLRRQTWIASTDPADLWSLPADPRMRRDHEGFGAQLRDPFSD
jgi:prevent-host-death family protein